MAPTATEPGESATSTDSTNEPTPRDAEVEQSIAATADPTPVEQEPTPLTSELIAARAYELFVERGGMHGNDLDDWLRAEQQLGGSEVEAERLTRALNDRPAN